MILTFLKHFCFFKSLLRHKYCLSKAFEASLVDLSDRFPSGQDCDIFRRRSFHNDSFFNKTKHCAANTVAGGPINCVLVPHQTQNERLNFADWIVFGIFYYALNPPQAVRHIHTPFIVSYFTG